MKAPRNLIFATPSTALHRATKSRVVALVFALLLATPAAAKKHPVPLDAKTDSAKCAECHADKTKGQAVHSAIAMGCTTCHEVRVTKDVTRVKLTSPTVTSLCVQCHSDKKASEAKGKVHPPAVSDCTTCHDPHTSANKNQLLKPTSGGKGENLCLQCHTKGLNVPEKGSRHAALDMGCDTCHVTHKTGDGGQREFRAHLTKATPALCLDCHDVSDAKLKQAHQNQPFEKADCATCHDPHASNAPKLVQTFAHNPFAEKMCDVCHQPAQGGKVVLTNSDSRALCLTCHDDKGKQIESAKVQHPGAMGECIACHDPHAGKSSGFLRPDPVSACTACHAEQAEQHKKRHLHQPAFEQGCATCHQPHGSENEHLLRAKTPNALCLECHGPKAAPQRLEAQHLVTIFNGEVKLPENYFDQVVRLPLKYGLGHPVDKHPVVDQMDPNDVTKVRTALNCLSCHQPHASAQPDLLVKDQANGMVFCASCHKNMGS